MRKSFLFLVLATSMILSIFCSCGKTPDVVAEEAEITLDKVDWSFDIEGADTTKYTIADAKKHELSKVICSMELTIEDANIASTVKSMRIDGIKFKEFLADIGKADATSATFYSQNINNTETIEYTMTAEEMNSDDILIGWICNLTDPIPDTQTYVGIFAASTIAKFPSVTSVTKIVFN